MARDKTGRAETCPAFVFKVPSHDSVSAHVASPLSHDAPAAVSESPRDICTRDVSARDGSAQALAGLGVLHPEQERQLAGRRADVVRQSATHVRQGADELRARMDVAGLKVIFSEIIVFSDVKCFIR